MSKTRSRSPATPAPAYALSERWHPRYRRGGVFALDRAPRTNAGQRRTDTAVVAFVERLALTRPRPSVATLHRLTVAEAERQGLPVPSYSTVRGTTRALDPALVTLALEGGPGVVPRQV